MMQECAKPKILFPSRKLSIYRLARVCVCYFGHYTGCKFYDSLGTCNKVAVAN